MLRTMLALCLSTLALSASTAAADEVPDPPPAEETDGGGGCAAAPEAPRGEALGLLFGAAALGVGLRRRR